MERRREDSHPSLDAAVTLSQARDHPGSRRWEDLCPPDARQRTRHPDRSPPRRASLAGRTSLRSRLTLESLASRERRTVRSIRMTLSLAFLTPEIVKAAVEGRLPRGFGLKRRVDLPMAWPDQWRTLGLQTPAQA
jgi:site-specific DNA recombinase